MAANFALALYPGNIGEQANQAFQQGQKTYRENTARNALSVLARDPTNKGALSALAQADPQTALDFRKQQLEYTKTQLAQHQDSIIKGAEILRQFQPKDQATYSQALAAAQAAGIDISNVPQQFDPAYVDGVVKIADAFKPQTGQQDPGIIREFDIATQRRLIPPGTTYEQYVGMRNPGSYTPVTIPYNSQVTSGTQAPVTATGPNGEKIQLNPQTGQWEPIGGQTPQASGGFPQ